MHEKDSDAEGTAFCTSSLERAIAILKDCPAKHGISESAESSEGKLALAVTEDL